MLSSDLVDEPTAEFAALPGDDPLDLPDDLLLPAPTPAPSAVPLDDEGVFETQASPVLRSFSPPPFPGRGGRDD